MTHTYLLLGSNDGDRTAWLQKGMEETGNTCGDIAMASAIYETEAWGLEDQPDFLNQVLCIHTALSPLELLAATQKIEDEFGRQRSVKWGQRTLDIDILLYGNEVIDLPELKIPHAFLQKRRFTLVPLAEIAPEVLHPILHKSIAQLLEECVDTLEVKFYE